MIISARRRNRTSAATDPDAAGEFSLVALPVQRGDKEAGLSLLAATSDDVRSARTLPRLLITHVVDRTADVAVARLAALQVLAHAPVAGLERK